MEKAEKKKNKQAEAAPQNGPAEAKTERGSKQEECAEEQDTSAQAAEKSGAAEQAANKQKDETLREIEQLKAEAEDCKRKWYAVTAEYENYRRRTALDSARRYAEGRADVVKGLFPIADNLERALSSCTDEATKKGISMVVASFENLLKEEKIEPLDPLGKPFDAETCEAILAVEPGEGEESGTVKQVYRKGYLQNGKVLRYAQVVVIK